MRIAPLFCAAAGLAMAPLSWVVSAQQPLGGTCPASAASCRAFTTYLDAFNRRDFAAFRAMLADDISVMFDEPGPPGRVDGLAAVDPVFRRVFPPAGSTDIKLPPPMVPEDLRWQEYGDAAVVSFVLRYGVEVTRRSVILARREQGWRVVHIHGSTRSTKSG